MGDLVLPERTRIKEYLPTVIILTDILSTNCVYIQLRIWNGSIIIKCIHSCFFLKLHFCKIFFLLCCDIGTVFRLIFLNWHFRLNTDPLLYPYITTILYNICLKDPPLFPFPHRFLHQVWMLKERRWIQLWQII